MKAIRVHEFGGPEVMKFEEVPDPTPGPGQVVVKVEAVGVNPVEAYLRGGMNPAQELPYTPGNDAAGTVAAVGEGVERVKVGARVLTHGTLTGAYAEKTLCEEIQVHRLPERLSFAQGAAVNVPYATAYRALFQRGKGVAGETVLVHGASGGVGTAAVQLAKAVGMTVIGTAGSEVGRKHILAQGADLALDHHATGYLDQAKDFTGGRGVDVILEMLANVNLGNDLPLLAGGGRVVVIGTHGPAEIDPRALWGSEGYITAASLFKATGPELVQIWSGLMAGLENGTLNPVIAVEIPLAEAPRAHEQIMAGEAHGKVVLVT
jgi:NADPH2:quinone reductase